MVEKGTDDAVDTLTVALFHALAFLGTAGDEVVDPDTSVAQLESALATLSGLSPAARSALASRFTDIARSQPSADVREFADSFVSDLLDDPDE